MNPISLIFALVAAPATAATAVTAPTDDPQDFIIVTGSREPVSRAETAASVNVVDGETIEALNLPLTSDVLRLMPGLSVATSGPAGSQTQLRIRGAEANHSLLFVDGIRFNDPAAGNEPRFEMLANDALSRIEIVRGPQSALWGSEALGGAVAIETADAVGPNRLNAIAEYGSLDSIRTGAQFSARTGDLGVSGSAGWLKSDGIDAFGAGGDRDGFENRSGSIKAVYRPGGASEIGIVGHWLEAKSEFDGFDPATFLHADTGDATRNRIWAIRAWGRTTSGGDNPWIASLSTSILDSRNRNSRDGDWLNSTFGRRFTVAGQLSRDLQLGGGNHRLTLAIDHEDEDFRARDQEYFGATDQVRSRNLTAYAGEWRAEWRPGLITDFAVRHDRFSDFADATTFRSTVLVAPFEGWTAHLAYGEGIAQPSFYDLFGFFPGSFAGNPALRPEKSRGWEVGARWTNRRTSISLTGFANRLRDEIVDVFDPVTFVSSTANADGKSGRKGLEFEASQKIGGHSVIAFNYTYLDADQQQVSGANRLREVRRPRHSANIIGTTRIGAFDAGAGLAYVGARLDTDFDSFPARTVKLGDYLLANFNIGWRIAPPLEAYVRVENAFDADYQDAVGYQTAGRTIYAGLRFRLGG